MRKAEFKAPECYLSTYEGKWKLIGPGEVLLCPATTRQEAEAVAARYGLSLPDVFWSGEELKFIPA